MGNTFGAQARAEVPAGVTKLNDSVWEFHSPEGSPEVDIIFFHGLQLGNMEEAFWTTWLALDDKGIEIWPKTWLSETFPNARILSVDYNSSATGLASGKSDLYALGENLVSDLILSEHGIGQYCPVILVGHSLGGIAIKQFVLSAIKWVSLSEDNSKTRKFLDNFEGVFFYAAPSRSSSIKDLADRLPSSPVLHLLKALDKEKERINEEFRSQRMTWHARSFGLVEAYPTNYKGFHGLVVSEASSRADVDNFYTNSRGDHFTVCRPRSKSDASFRKLAQFIEYSTSSELAVSVDELVF